jgi:hypothetical protein
MEETNKIWKGEDHILKGEDHILCYLGVKFLFS